MQRAFVIRPFGKKADASGTAIDFEQVHERLIAPALKDAGLGGGTTGEIIDAGNVREDMFSLIIEADLVVCDITVHNANVFYELGIRHALRKRRTVLIKGDPVLDATPFDVNLRACRPSIRGRGAHYVPLWAAAAKRFAKKWMSGTVPS